MPGCLPSTTRIPSSRIRVTLTCSHAQVQAPGQSPRRLRSAARLLLTECPSTIRTSTLPPNRFLQGKTNQAERERGCRRHPLFLLLRGYRLRLFDSTHRLRFSNAGAATAAIASTGPDLNPRRRGGRANGSHRSFRTLLDRGVDAGEVFDPRCAIRAAVHGRVARAGIRADALDTGPGDGRRAGACCQ